MDTALFLEITQGALFVGSVICVPVLIPGLVIGILISLFQAVTQISEQTLTFVPKIVVMVVTLLITGPWILRYTMDYFIGLIGRLTDIAHSGIVGTSMF